MNVKKRGLGKGLGALMSKPAKVAIEQPRVLTPSTGIYEQQPIELPAESHIQGLELLRLPVEQLSRSPYQPRKEIEPEALKELAESIKAQGVIQPIVVRKCADQQYEIIAGERRWRAVQLAGIAEIPCLIKQVDDETAMAMALIENIQREDLNAMEEAVALQRLIDEFGLKQQEVADAVGKSRSTITNLLRLNNLNEDVKILLERGDIEMGHARALLSLEGLKQTQAAKTVVARGLTVRETERLVRNIITPPPAKSPKAIDPNLSKLQESLSERLGANVSIDHGNKGKGKVVIQYNTLDELEGILNHIQ